MPRPPILAYVEPELISSAIDNTSVHSNIDKFLLEDKMLRGSEEFYNNSSDTDYGNPYKYKKDIKHGSPDERIKDDKFSESIPLNMSHYADIMKRANISKAFKETDVGQIVSKIFDPQKAQDSLISMMEKGDVPGGLIAYYEPNKQYEDIKGKDALHQGGAAAYYSEAKDTSAAPDTIKIFDN